MKVLAQAHTENGAHLYQLVQSASGVFRLRKKSLHSRRIEVFELDYDRRHQRLFLTERDERRAGLGGLVMLDYLTRRVLER